MDVTGLDVDVYECSFSGLRSRAAPLCPAPMPTYFCPPPRMISLNVMAEEKQQPAESGSQPATKSTQTADGEKSPQSRQGQEQRRTDRRDRPRHHGSRRDRPRREQQQPQKPPVQGQPQRNERDADTDEGEEEPSRQAPSRSYHHRGGRPPKKIIEEWENDPYCE